MRMNFHILTGFLKKRPDLPVCLRSLAYTLDSRETAPVVGQVEFRRAVYQPIGFFPSRFFSIGADDLQAHTKTDRVPATKTRRTRANVSDF